MADVIAEERTTLPEGATVSVSRIKRPKLGYCNELRAWMGNEIVKMRVDNITPQNLRWYLDQVLAAINRERLKLLRKPVMLFQTPKTIPDFVNNMAFYGMFILEPAPIVAQDSITKVSDEPKTIDQHIADLPADKPKKRRRKAKKEVAVTIPANGSVPI